MELHHVLILFQVITFLFAISVHESAHAWMANRLGDPTARMLGRITLNPIKHIDPIGTVVLPAIAILYNFPVIGWAKPVPVDPRNFKNEVRDDILTSVIAPISNIVLAAMAVVMLIIIAKSSAEGHLIVTTLGRGAIIDTNSLLLPIVMLLYSGMLINVVLAVFNLIPVPPLDGSHVLRHMLSESARDIYDRFGMILLLLVFMLGVVRYLTAPIVGFLRYILATVS